MAEDALERLKRRQHRPIVPTRDTSLESPPAAEQVSQDISIPRNLEFKKSEGIDFKTKQTTMRLEQSVSDRIQNLCQQRGISREVLIEALFLHCEGDRQALEAVLKDAVARHEHRMQVANKKRAQTMIEKFGG
jgi:hypothetical protein